jgi:heptaprenyl diphosphate synthase
MDFREGILTLPVLYALENEVCRTSVMALMEKARQGAFDKTDEIHLNKMLHESGGMARARETARALADELHTCVDKLPPNKNNTYFRGMIRKLSDIL